MGAVDEMCEEIWNKMLLHTCDEKLGDRYASFPKKAVHICMIRQIWGIEDRKREG